ncbi:hypothetical protein DEO72_LG10g1280 [Vigna unguiculata]|uniref:Uncharacterized protein n=1 Tax=Vigna unguiculata TaxID=3917 RepID=A0A4D6NBA5_VIGUN|nr:hypothetical protein DEO72_LG10g1280 [Vigna unguiculata]
MTTNSSANTEEGNLPEPIRTSHDLAHSIGLSKPPGYNLEWPRVTPIEVALRDFPVSNSCSCAGLGARAGSSMEVDNGYHGRCSRNWICVLECCTSVSRNCIHGCCNGKDNASVVAMAAPTSWCVVNAEGVSK